MIINYKQVETTHHFTIRMSMLHSCHTHSLGHFIFQKVVNPCGHSDNEYDTNAVITRVFANDFRNQFNCTLYMSLDNNH